MSLDITLVLKYYNETYQVVLLCATIKCIMHRHHTNRASCNQSVLLFLSGSYFQTLDATLVQATNEVVQMWCYFFLTSSKLSETGKAYQFETYCKNYWK